MIRFFRRGSARDDFIEAIRPELEALRVPAATDALRARIIASRESGVRYILPAPQRPPRSLSFAAAIAIAAAALILALIPVRLHRSAATASGADVASTGLFGEVAFAQAPKRSIQPKLAPVQATGSRLRAVSLEMERRVTNSRGEIVGRGNLSLQLSPSMVGTSSAWRIVSVNREPLPTPHVDVETVYVSRADLKLLRRDIHVTPYNRFQRINVSQQFTGDSVSGRMTTEGPSIGAGRTFARALPPAFGPFITSAVAPVFLMAASLGPSWRGTVSLLGWAVRDDDVLLPIELRVESSETITVPAGRFDCWRLSLRYAGRQVDYWVRKTDGLGVRVLDETDARTKGARETVLTGIQ